MADTLCAFEQAVLLSILRLGEDAYGRAILKVVQARLDRDVELAPFTQLSGGCQIRVW